MRKREMGEEDEDDMADTRGYKKSGAWITWLGLEDLVSVLSHAGFGLLPAVLGMVQLTSTWNSLKSHFLMIISLISFILILNWNIT